MYNIYIYIYDIYIYCRSQKGCPVEIYTYIYISITCYYNIWVNARVILPCVFLRVRFSVERFAVYKADVVFGLFTMEIGISKIILPKEL